MKTTNMITMKTIYILAAFLGLQFNTLFAIGNYSESSVLSTNDILGISTAKLIPIIPMEATFEEVGELYTNILSLSGLAPVMPMAADFNDEAPALEVSLTDLAPTTPKEADFEDVSENKNINAIQDLAPVTPVYATFEDLL